MKTQVKLKATTKEIYDAILTSVIGETKQHCGKDITLEDLNNGYKYRHKVQQGKKIVDTTVHIKKPIENKNVHLSISYPDQNFDMDYSLEAISDKETMITYQQIGSKDTGKESSIQKFLFDHSMKKRLKRMEKYIISNRDKKEETNK
jgi:hypothetical protein